MGADTQVEIEGKRLKLSNLDKVFYPKTGFTKGQVIDYYTRVSAALLPHLKKRPGLSGYFTIASALNDLFRAEGPLTVSRLAHLSAAEHGDLVVVDGVVGEDIDRQVQPRARRVPAQRRRPEDDAGEIVVGVLL